MTSSGSGGTDVLASSEPEHPASVAIATVSAGTLDACGGPYSAYLPTLY
ncbi:hypothetical protein [Halalkalirubrum salinum]|nr:hypothetical protein [Halalkalirubrum salinum]